MRRLTKVLLITANLLTAIALITGCYGSRFDPSKYWYTGLFTLASFYFLVILVGFIFFWLFAKKSLALISIIAIALCWLPLKKVVPIKLTNSFSIQKQEKAIRVMSWNVEHFDILEHKTHPERKQQMISMINKYQPAIACFQEMVASDSVSPAINYLPDFLKQLGMQDYHYSYNPKLDFDNKHRFGIIIFSKYPIIKKQTIKYLPNDYNSIFQFADIVTGADTFRIFNVHLQSLKFTVENRRYIDDPSIEDENDIDESKTVIAKLKTGFLRRKVQSERIKEAINASPYPAIVCGDFNDVPNSYAYNTIGLGMKNVFEEKGAGIGRTFYSISPTLRIDNIFTDRGFKVEQYVRVKKKLSDHFPIVADLVYER